MSTLHIKTCEVGPKPYSEENLKLSMLIRRRGAPKVMSKANDSRG